MNVKYVFMALQFSAVLDDHWLDWAIHWSSLGGFNGGYDIHSINDLTKDGVSTVEPWGFDGGDEKLRSVGVWTSVGLHMFIIIHCDDLYVKILVVRK